MLICNISKFFRMTQDQALSILKTGANVFLTGEPGSGKTHTVNRYVSYLRERGVEPAITASTGIAATHIGGMTIHSWSGIGIRDELTSHDLKRITGNRYVVRRVSKTKILIIDEISMLDARIFSMADLVCREIRQSAQPFGGLQIVGVGDFFQLPPVAREGQISQFAFQSDVWKEMNPVICYLKDQYRQDDTMFLSILAAIRSNTLVDNQIRHIETRLTPHHNMPAGVTKLFTHNVDVDRINNEALARLPGETITFLMHSQGPKALVANLRKGCLSPEILELKDNAIVMFTKNNPQSRFANGTLGRVVGFGKASGYPIVRIRGGTCIEVAPMEWTVEENGKARAKITQIPVRLAWAITVHKSQGMSLDAAVIDLKKAFEFGQGYVALSRVRRLVGVYLLGYNDQSFMIHPSILAQDQTFRAQSNEAKKFFGVIPQPELEQKQKCFIISCGGKKSEIKENKYKSWLQGIREKHSNAYRLWSKEDDAQLCDLFENGISVNEIAEKFGRQRGSIHSRLVKIGLLSD